MWMSQLVSDQLLNLGPLTTDAAQSGCHTNRDSEVGKKDGLPLVFYVQDDLSS